MYLGFGAWSGSVALLYAVISIASIAFFARTGNFRLLLRIQLADILLAPTLSMIALGGFLPCGSRHLGHPRPTRCAGPRWCGRRRPVVHRPRHDLPCVGAHPDRAGVTSPLPESFSSVLLALNVTVGGTIFFTLLALFAKQHGATLDR